MIPAVGKQMDQQRGDGVGVRLVVEGLGQEAELHDMHGQIVPGVLRHPAGDQQIERPASSRFPQVAEKDHRVAAHLFVLVVEGGEDDRGGLWIFTRHPSESGNRRHPDFRIRVLRRGHHCPERPRIRQQEWLEGMDCGLTEDQVGIREQFEQQDTDLGGRAVFAEEGFEIPESLETVGAETDLAEQSLQRLGRRGRLLLHGGWR